MTALLTLLTFSSTLHADEAERRIATLAPRGSAWMKVHESVNGVVSDGCQFSKEDMKRMFDGADQNRDALLEEKEFDALSEALNSYNTTHRGKCKTIKLVTDG